MTSQKQWADMTTDERNDYVRHAVKVFRFARDAAAAVGTTKNSIVSCSHRAGVRFAAGRNPDSPNGRKSRALSPDELEARRLARAERKAEREKEKAQRRPQTSFNAFVRTKTADTPEDRAGEAAGRENGGTKAAKVAAEAKAWGRIDALPIWDALPEREDNAKELWEAGAFECHWPIWRDGTDKYMVCGCRTTPGELYCDEHRRIAGGRKVGTRPGDNDERTINHASKSAKAAASHAAAGSAKGSHLRLVSVSPG